MSCGQREKFYNSRRWRKCSKAFAESKLYICENCGRTPQMTESGRYIVHHKIHLTDDNYQDDNIALNFDNLELLCLECHNKEHFGLVDAWGRRLRFDDEGNLKKF